MIVDALAVRLRPRSILEAADLGAVLCRAAAGQVYAAFAVASLPVAAIAIASMRVSWWLPFVIIWWAKPWLDRTILFVLSRTAFGQTTTLGDVWRAKWAVWWRQWPLAVTVRRLSPWRTFTQPVYQLEGTPWHRSWSRVSQIRQRHMLGALLVTSAFACAELAMWASLCSLWFWFAPAGQEPDLTAVFFGAAAPSWGGALLLAYAASVIIIEPFYVAAGFAMYLTRRAALEAWDIEQEFRRAFAA